MKKALIILPILIFLTGLTFGTFITPNVFFIGENSKDIEITFIGLFKHNLKAIICNVAGVISFGFSTSINIFMTAFFLGANIKRATTAGCKILFILQHTLPHFTEYIAIFISGYLGFSGFELLMTHTFSKEYFIKKLLLLLITIPLLLIAAYMEVKFAYY